MFGYDYINQRIEAYERDKAYRVYLTDGLKVLTENTGGKALNVRYYDLFKEVKEENPKEIITRITNKLKGKAGE